ncbi:MAG: hypothetical protein WD176_05190, partial [Pirellulales bacterium]
MQSCAHRKRPLRTIEALEQRHMLAAPVAVNDSYALDEDGVLVTGTGSVLGATFDSVGAPALASGANWSYLDRIQNSLGAAQTYPTDSASRVWNAPAFDIGNSTIGPWGTSASPIQAGTIDAWPGRPDVLDGIDDAPSGTDNIVTTYLFRNTFSLSAAQAAATQGTIRALCDDGCVFYINGFEAARLGMPSGAVNTETFALGATGTEAGYTNVP